MGSYTCEKAELDSAPVVIIDPAVQQPREKKKQLFQTRIGKTPIPLVPSQFF